MNPREKKYHHWVLAVTGLYVFAVISYWNLAFPTLEPHSNLILASVMLSLIALGLAVTTAVNHFAGRLHRGNTNVQIVVLILSVYGIPLGLWGIRLLTKQSDSEVASRESGDS